MRAALDTNILVNAEGVHGQKSQDAAMSLMKTLPRDRVILPVQVLGELFNVLVKRAGRSREDARARILGWQGTFQLADTSAAAMLCAIDLATEHRIFMWDALIIAVSAEVGCRLLLSEDMQDGFSWGPITVTNPFSPTRHRLLAALLDQDDR